jgi:hypothetical protein
MSWKAVIIRNVAVLFSLGFWYVVYIAIKVVTK